MEREVFKSKPLGGLPIGLIRGFMFGCLILLIGLALGMDEELFLPLLGAAMILSGIIGIISGIGKRIEADKNGIYQKSKEYLFAKNNMVMQVYTQYYSFIPVTERYIAINGNDGKHTVKCSFLGSKDAGRLAKIIEDGMRSKYRTAYDDHETNRSPVQTFIIPAAQLAEKLDKRSRLLIKLMFWFLTILFSWILISLIINDELEEQGLWLVLFMALSILILGGTSLFICRKFKKSARIIPYEVVFVGGQCYIDGKAFGGAEVSRVTMTPERGYSKGDMRKLAFYGNGGKIGEYDFGFKTDKSWAAEYGQLTEAVKNHFGDKFAYDIN